MVNQGLKPAYFTLNGQKKMQYNRRHGRFLQRSFKKAARNNLEPPHLSSLTARPVPLHHQPSLQYQAPLSLLPPPSPPLGLLLSQLMQFEWQWQW